MKRKITDADGAVWPVTGYWCTGCGWPMWAAGPDGRHPTCATPGGPTDTPAMRERALELLAAELGGRPLDTWRRTGRPVAGGA